MRSRGEFQLLKTLGSSLESYRNIKSAKRFYHTVMYNGKDDETITDTRVRYYQNQKVKTSTYLISDERSIDQHLLRSDLQCLIWLQCTEQNMVIPPFEGRGRGWYIDKEGYIKPVWYEGEQLPPSLRRRRSKKSNPTVATVDEEPETNSFKESTDDELGEMPFVEPVLKKRRTTTSTEGNIMPDSLIDSEEVQSPDSEGSTSSDSEWGWLDTDSGDTSDEDDDPDW